jgi:hypothetical protein
VKRKAWSVKRQVALGSTLHALHLTLHASRPRPGNHDDAVRIVGIRPTGDQGHTRVVGRGDPQGVLPPHFKGFPLFFDNKLLHHVILINRIPHIQVNCVPFLHVYQVTENLSLDIMMSRQHGVARLTRRCAGIVPASDVFGHIPYAKLATVLLNDRPADGYDRRIYAD